MIDDATALRLVTPLVETVARSAIQKGVEAVAERTGGAPDASTVETSFADFLARTYTKCSHLNTLVLPREKVELSKLYVPLTIGQKDKEQPEWEIDNSVEDIQTALDRTLIVDRAGKGKSTLLQRLVLLLIEKQHSIPFFIELRRLRKDHTLLDEIYSQIDPVEGEFDREFLWEVIDRGDCTFFLDGYDEVNDDVRSEVTDQITDFARRVPEAPIYMTSRPEMALSAFGDFTGYSIEDLSFEEACQLCRNYDDVSGFDISEDLIDDVKERSTRTREFLGNPFLVSLLYQTYSLTNNIPSSRATFCEEVYTALYKHHDLTKDAFERDKRSGLTLGKFRAVLRHLAFEMLKRGEYEARRGSLTAYIDTIENRVRGAEFEVDDFLYDAVVSVPLLVEEGGFYEWAHRSIQEFFAAEFVAYELDDAAEGASRLYELASLKWLGLFEFLTEIDEAVVEDGVLLNIFADIERYYEEHCDSGQGVAPNSQWCSLRAGVSCGTQLRLAVADDLKGLTEWVEEHEDEFESYVDVHGGIAITAAGKSFRKTGQRVGLVGDDADNRVFLLFSEGWASKVLSAAERVGYTKHLEAIDSSELEDKEVSLGDNDVVEVDWSAENPVNRPGSFETATVIWAQHTGGYRYDEGQVSIISGRQCAEVRRAIQRNREKTSDAELLSDLS